jgi:hypothetical protein
MMDRPGRQPAEPLVERFQSLDVGASRLKHRIALAGFFRLATVARRRRRRLA